MAEREDEQAKISQALRLLGGDLELWQRAYAQALFQATIKKDEYDFPILDFDYGNRELLYSFVNSEVLKGDAIDYLEFGVHKGVSMNKWTKINTHHLTRFFGFDSFEGLPEDWISGRPKGYFHTGGEAPPNRDKRVTFIKGWFHETLPDFLSSFDPMNRLVLHMDADLYSSTLYVLMSLNEHIRPGTVILFDEFKGRDEHPAFYDYTRSCYRKWRFLAARRDFVKVATIIDE